MLSLTKGRSKLDVSRSKVAPGLRASPYHWCHGDSTTQALEATRGPARPTPTFSRAKIRLCLTAKNECLFAG